MFVNVNLLELNYYKMWILLKEVLLFSFSTPYLCSWARAQLLCTIHCSKMILVIFWWDMTQPVCWSTAWSKLFYFLSRKPSFVSLAAPHRGFNSRRLKWLWRQKAPWLVKNNSPKQTVYSSLKAYLWSQRDHCKISLILETPAMFNMSFYPLKVYKWQITRRSFIGRL